MKEGNPFEDIALIDAIYNHIMKVSGYQLHIRDTCKSLIEISKDYEAREIQMLYKKIIITMNDSLNEIWTEEMQIARPCLSGLNIDYTKAQNEQRYSMIGNYWVDILCDKH